MPGVDWLELSARTSRTGTSTWCVTTVAIRAGRAARSASVPKRRSPTPKTHGHARQAAKATWAKLIRKVYEVDPLVCPKCGAQMRVIALIEDPAVIERILSWLGLWHPLPACGPSRPAEHANLPFAYHPVPDIA